MNNVMILAETMTLIMFIPRSSRLVREQLKLRTRHLFEWWLYTAEGNVEGSSSYLKHFISQLQICFEFIALSHTPQTDKYFFLSSIYCVAFCRSPQDTLR